MRGPERRVLVFVRVPTWFTCADPFCGALMATGWCRDRRLGVAGAPKAQVLSLCAYVFSHMAEAEREKTSNMTFSVPERLKRRAQTRSDVNWSAVVAQAIEERLNGLELLDKITARTHLTDKDVDELADVVDTAMARHFGVLRP